MSEVDRLSNSGLYPALPIADKKSRRDGSNQQQPPPSSALALRPAAATRKARKRRDRPNPSSTIMPSVVLPLSGL